MRYLTLVLLGLLTTPVACFENVDLNLNRDKSDWVDFLDPFSNEHGSKTFALNQRCSSEEELLAYQKELNRLIEANKILKAKKAASVDVLLKHVLRRFLMQLDVELTTGYEVKRNARVYLSPNDAVVVSEYLNSQKEVEEIALREKLRVALENFIVIEDTDHEQGLIIKIRRFLPCLIVLNVVFLPFVIVNVLRRLMGPRPFLGFFLVATFCLSYYFTYVRKYQEVLADRFLRIDHSSDACSPKGLIAEAFGVLLSYVQIKGKNQCLQKYEDLLVEPFLLVDPLQVFGEVVTNFLMSPFSVIGIHLNKFFNDFFVSSPILLTFVKLIFIILVLFYLSGYRIRTIFATIEPAGHQSPVIRRSLIQNALRDSQQARGHVDYADPLDTLMVMNLDDSNVTKRRRLKRSQSLPRIRALQ